MAKKLNMQSYFYISENKKMNKNNNNNKKTVGYWVGTKSEKLL